MPEFTTTGAELLDAATFAAQIAPARSSSPELGAVVIDVYGGPDVATFSAYDRITAGSTTLFVQDAAPGRLLVSARLLAAIAATTSREPSVRLATQGTPLSAGVAHVTAGRSRWELPLLDERYYPPLPKPGPVVGTVGGPEFADALGRVLTATGDPNTPPMYGGLALAGSDTELTLAATDRWRLSVIEMAWTPDVPLPDTVIPKAVGERMAFAARREEQVSLHLAESGVALSGQRYWVHGPVIATPDPRVWRKVDLADDNAVTTVTIDTAEFKQVVARASALLDPKDALLLTVGRDPNDDTIEIGMLDGPRGQVHHACPAITEGEAPKTVGVDGQYLRQAVDVLDAPTVRLHLFEGRKRGMFLLLPLDEAGAVIPGCRHVVMAKRVTADTSSAAA